MLSLSDLVNNKKKRDEKKEEVFSILLKECCSKIKKADEMNNLYCIYQVPEFILGYPIYNLNESVQYLINEVSKRGFQTQYIFPNVLIIAWFNVLETDKKNKSKNNNQVKDIVPAPARRRGRPPNPNGPKNKNKQPTQQSLYPFLTITHQKTQV